MTTAYSRFYSYAALAFVCAALFISNSAPASAQTIPEIKLGGWAWSSNIGWISLSCENDNNCASSTYGVTIKPNRQLDGWAWSSNIGWIKFYGLSANGGGGGTAGGSTAGSAQVTGTYPNLKIVGWARACAGTNNPTTSEKKDCSTMAINDNSGGWDGWISFSGTTHSTSLNASTGMNSDAWAWGSDVIGWIDMHSRVTINQNKAALSVKPCTIAPGANKCNSYVTNWSIPTNYTDPELWRADSTVISTEQSGSNLAVNNIPHGTTIFRLRNNGADLNPNVVASLKAACAGDAPLVGGVCPASGVTTPDITIKVVPPVVRMGGTATIDVTISPSPYSGICTITGPGVSRTMADNDVSETVTTGPIKNRSTIKVSCEGDGLTEPVVETATVDVIPLAQEV